MWVSLNDVGKNDVALVGGKGASLGEMLRAGIPLPGGFCLTADAYRFMMESGGLLETVREAMSLKGVSQGEPAACTTAEQLIRIQIEAAPIPPAVRAAVEEGYLRLEQGKVAVRSSATAEDLPDASFAGQQETFLNVHGLEQVLLSVQKCWSSLWTARAISYRARQGFSPDEVALSVVVQKMVDAEVAGVLFTMNPVNGRRDEMLINASYGLGEAVVSGLVTPDTFRMSRGQGNKGKRLLETHLGSKALQIRALVDGGTVTEEVPLEARERPCLPESALLELLRLGERVEMHYGTPQDLEWAYAKGRLYLLQARPITTVEAGERRKLSRLEHRTLDDLLEHYPEPPWPLDHAPLTEMYDQILQTMGDVGMRVVRADEIIVMDKDGISRLRPAVPRPGWGLWRVPSRLMKLLREAPTAWRGQVLGTWLEHRRAIGSRRLAEESLSGLGGLLRDVLELAARIGRLRFAEPLTAMFFKGIALHAYAFLARRRVGTYEWLAGLSYRTLQVELGLQALSDTLLSDPELRRLFQSSAPSEAEAALETSPAGRAFLAQVEAFLSEHGARTPMMYLTFSSLSWSENRPSLFTTLQAMVRSGKRGGSTARAEEGRRRFEQLRSEVVRALPGFLRSRFETTLEAFREYHVAREETVYQIEACYSEARRIAAEIAARLTIDKVLQAPEDLLFVPLETLLKGLREGQWPETLGRDILRRRARRPVALTVWKSQRAVPVAPSGNRLSGVAGSPGQADGRARVILGPESFGTLQAGEVLVCPFTDPTWTPLFGLAAAVVADTGGPLSHAAIVAREYGIPAVLGTQVGTQHIKQGQLIRVDGAGGWVALLEEPSEAE